MRLYIDGETGILLQAEVPGTLSKLTSQWTGFKSHTQGHEDSQAFIIIIFSLKAPDLIAHYSQQNQYCLWALSVSEYSPRYLILVLSKASILSYKILSLSGNWLLCFFRFVFLTLSILVDSSQAYNQIILPSYHTWYQNKAFDTFSHSNFHCIESKEAFMI